MPIFQHILIPLQFLYSLFCIIYICYRFWPPSSRIIWLSLLALEDTSFVFLDFSSIFGCTLLSFRSVLMSISLFPHSLFLKLIVREVSSIIYKFFSFSNTTLVHLLNDIDFFYGRVCCPCC